MTSNMDGHHSLSISLHGVQLVLESDNENLISYAQVHLASLLCLPTPDPRIRVRLHWGHELMPQSAPLDHYRRLSRRLLLADNSILQTEISQLPGLQLGASMADTALSLDAAFQLPKKKGLIPLSLFKSQQSSEYVYAVLIYYLVYFPMMWYLERRRRWFPLHASAVARPQGAIILAGLGGVGKSTLTLAFLTDPQAKLLSENIVLYGADQVYAFPELIHLDEQSRRLLTSLDSQLKPTGQAFSHSRRSYEVAPSSRVEAAKPRLFFLLRQGAKLEIKPLTTIETVELALSSDILAKELNEYAQQAAVLNLLSPLPGGHQQRLETLQQMIENISCYELTVKPEQDLSEATALVRETMT